MNLGLLAAISAPTAGLVIALIALYRAKAQQHKDQAETRKIEFDLNKEIANRRLVLERWADDVERYHRTLRTYLLKLIDDGVIDAEQVDMMRFPQPPKLPKMNGDIHDDR